MTPLHQVMGFAQLIELRGGSEEVRELVEGIIAAGEELRECFGLIITSQKLSRAERLERLKRVLPE